MDPFAPFHPDLAPLEEPLPRIDGEPDGFEVAVINKLSTRGAFRALTGDSSLIVGTLRVGRDWAEWHPPGGRPMHPIALDQVARVDLSVTQQRVNDNIVGQWVFTGQDGRRQYIDLYWSKRDRERSEEWLEWVADSLTARARRARGEPYDKPVGVAAQITSPDPKRPSPLRVIDQDLDGVTLAAPAMSALANGAFFGGLATIVLGCMGISTVLMAIHPLLGLLPFVGGVPMVVFGAIARQRGLLLRIDSTGLTARHFWATRLPWSAIDEVVVLPRSASHFNGRHRQVLRIVRSDGGHLDLPFAVGDSPTRSVTQAHLDWLADRMNALVLRRHGGKVPDLLQDLRAMEEDRNV